MGCGDRPVGLRLAGMPGGGGWGWGVWGVGGGAGRGQLSVRARVPLKGGERKGFQEERQGRVAGTWSRGREGGGRGAIPIQSPV